MRLEGCRTGRAGIARSRVTSKPVPAADAGATAAAGPPPRERGQNRSTASVVMTPHENAIMQRPVTSILPFPAAGTEGSTTGSGTSMSGTSGHNSPRQKDGRP